MREKSGEMDMEIHFKDAFRAFSKDDEGGQRRYLICCFLFQLIWQYFVSKKYF